MQRERIVRHRDILAVGTHEAVRVGDDNSHTPKRSGGRLGLAQVWSTLLNVRDNASGGVS